MSDLKSKSTSVAGKSGGSHIHLGAIPQFSIWRSIVKTFSIRPPAPTGYLGSGFGVLPYLGKIVFLLTLAGAPAAFITSYAVPKMMKQLIESDPELADAQSFIVSNPQQRIITYRPDMQIKDVNKVWDKYLSAYNNIGFGEVSFSDDPDGETRWKAFGVANAVNSKGTSFTGNAQQRCSLGYFYQHFGNDRFLIPWTAGLLADSIKMWGEDVYHTYYHQFFNVPVEDRLEGLPQEYKASRRIMKRFYYYGGPGNYKNLSFTQGYIAPLSFTQA